MHKKALSLVIIALLFSCDKHTQRESRYLNNQMEEQFTVLETKNGSFVKDGDYTKLFPDGTPKIKSHYVKDSLNAEYLEWFENGKKHIQGSYKNGKKIGKWSSWFENERMNSIENYDGSGERDGDFKIWGRDGKYLIHRVYANGNDVNLPASFKNEKYGNLVLNQNSTYSFTCVEKYFKRFGKNSVTTSSGKFSMNFEFLILNDFGYLRIGRFSKDSLIIKYLPNDIIYLRE